MDAEDVYAGKPDMPYDLRAYANNIIAPQGAPKILQYALIMSAAKEIETLRSRPSADPGWVCVPMEPTPEMMRAGFLVSEGEHDPAGVYRAMTAAAPTADAATHGEVMRE